MGALLFLISRLWFLNWDEVFFDSGEYISRWANPNYFSAIISGHPPLHLGYILYNWPVFRLFERQGLNPLPAILLVQVTLALLCVFFFGKVVSRLVEDKTANRAMILVSLLPIFWIVNVTVMMETGYLFFFFGSLFFLSKYTSGDEKYRYVPSMHHSWRILLRQLWIRDFTGFMLQNLESMHGFLLMLKLLVGI
ncbi:MAG: hypothetical protein UW62_C0017G0002 [Candidatus Collierbacteria bacterium GW2011_GWB1_44_35]|uniref:Glycosyltransferase RgtA/B/C/D-like domain-containing protein n=1 Tax=Candidatus Collierbacteria bacterium GW2011_GWB1_44_35 TaxID=1618383 RepID=A0A0G1J8W6_9BACT|nr:MAG: hypothetical protein UW62_C0017G0002 [Candidatus Collierbacteria bacterium GW2011_GWB1_44_35]